MILCFCFLHVHLCATWMSTLQGESPENASNKWSQVLKDYTQVSTLHGLKYVTSDESKSTVRRYCLIPFTHIGAHVPGIAFSKSVNFTLCDTIQLWIVERTISSGCVPPLSNERPLLCIRILNINNALLCNGLQ